MDGKKLMYSVLVGLVVFGVLVYGLSKVLPASVMRFPLVVGGQLLTVGGRPIITPLGWKSVLIAAAAGAVAGYIVYRYVE